ncbi:hypothetical protein TELCIR_12376 [Teladorsagia circumcincta]|uniref:Uncharacterized protein n=1 Tax=Teladorsagia circumcincta TaxID=45464 RepID=A0A2G9U6Q4_TELCI|nr:hypothetical protein TELCIR_12376 [Teladorsagia circumcincta]
MRTLRLTLVFSSTRPRTHCVMQEVMDVRRFEIGSCRDRKTSKCGRYLLLTRMT